MKLAQLVKMAILFATVFGLDARYDFIQIIPCRRKSADGGYIGIKRTYVDIVALFVGGFIYPSIVRTNFRQHP